MSTDRSYERLLGAIFVALSAVCYSLAGVFTLLIGTDVWTMLFVRGCVASVFIAIVLLVREGRQSLSGFGAILTCPGALAVAASTIAMYFNLQAYRHTDVANVVLIYAIAPFVAAALAYLIFGEKVKPHVLLASVAAFAGALVIVAGSLANGNVVGDLYALAMTFFMALMMVAIRWGRAMPMVHMACVSALCSAVFAAPFAQPLSASAIDIAYLTAFGVLQLGMGLIFLTLGSQRLPAGEAALIGALDVPLAPLWVWAVFATLPPAQTLAGGAVIAGAVVFALRGDRRVSHLEEQTP